MKYVYLAKAGDSTYKVGIARNVTERIKTLQTSNPNKIYVVMTRLVDEAYNIENATHYYLKQELSGGGKEWFTLQPEQVIELCLEICKNPEIDVSYEITTREVINMQNKIQQQLDNKLNILVKRQRIAKSDYQPIPLLADLPIAPRPVLSVSTTPNKVQDTLILDLAITVIKSEGRASTSLLQRKMSIGYGRAAKIMDQLEAMGIITKSDGLNSPRQLIVKE